MSVFDQFTNKYSLSKTLRFELKPVGKTQEMLKENNVFDIDRAIREKYIKTKPFFDRLHREFIQAGLEGFVFSDLREYEAALKKFMDDRKNKTLRNTVEDKEGCYGEKLL